VATLDTTRHKRGEQLTAEADKYLYDAKRAGRNRVCGPASM
jgi:PleD family two-component response regulator